MSSTCRHHHRSFLVFDTQHQASSSGGIASSFFWIRTYGRSFTLTLPIVNDQEFVALDSGSIVNSSNTVRITCLKNYAMLNTCNSQSRVAFLSRLSSFQSIEFNQLAGLIETMNRLQQINELYRSRKRDGPPFRRIFYVSLFAVLRRRGEGNTCESGFPSSTSSRLHSTSRSKVFKRWNFLQASDVNVTRVLF